MELTSGREIEPLLRESLKERVGERNFNRWFAGGVRFSLGEGQLTVAAPNNFCKEWLSSHYRQAIAETCRGMFGRETPLRFLVEEKPKGEPVPEEPDTLTLNPGSIVFKGAETQAAADGRVGPAASRRRAERTAGRKFASYDTFIVGVSNSAAKKIADVVIDRPGMLNPVLIYGPTSVGKTHLLEGVYSEFRRKSGRRSPKYLTADEFTALFKNSFQERPGENRPLRARLAESSLLVIEDIQNLENRPGTQRELVGLIDLLVSRGIQAVFSADRPLSEMEFLKTELRTRLESGIVCGIETPDRETLLRVFRQMAEKRMLAVPDEVCRFVVSRFTAHARQLSGALNLLHAAFLTGGDITSVESAAKILGTLTPCRRMPVSLEEIENAVTAAFGVQAKDLRGRSRSRQCSYPRMLAMWLARKYTNSALSEIGRHFGGRSHSTVAAAQKKVDLWLEEKRDSDLAQALHRVEQALDSRNR